MIQHLISMAQMNRADLDRVMNVALRLRRQRQANEPHDPILAGKTLAMIFEKPSLRTRVSFHCAMVELGGQVVVMVGDEVGLEKRESSADVARVLGGMVHGICARVFEHDKLEKMAAHSSVPVINALSDEAHPCQALADWMTLIDAFGQDLSGRRVVFIGDGNNVARSLAVLCAKVGMKFTLASPADYSFPEAFVAQLKGLMPEQDLTLTDDPVAAVADADALYADTWTSMGQEQEKAHRLKVFTPFQVSESLLSQAPDHAVVLHCLPAYREVEITSAVLDGPRSRVFLQAHNRLHAQKGLLAVLLAQAQ